MYGMKGLLPRNGNIPGAWKYGQPTTTTTPGQDSEGLLPSHYSFWKLIPLSKHSWFGEFISCAF